MIFFRAIEHYKCVHCISASEIPILNDFVLIHCENSLCSIALKISHFSSVMLQSAGCTPGHGTAGQAPGSRGAWKEFIFPAGLLCAPQKLNSSVSRAWSCKAFMGGNRVCGADVELCVHKGFRVSRVTQYMRCGIWNLALIFNHTFDSEKSNPPFYQFSSIQFRRKRKRNPTNYRVA